MSEKLTRIGNAVVNTDQEEYQKYITERNRLRKSKAEIQDVNTRIERLETDIGDIKSLLKQLLEK